MPNADSRRKSIPQRPVLARKPPCPPTLRPPSVAFVTSVRCFPRFAQFSHGSHRIHNPQASLCGLRDLCAMLSPIRPVLARKPPCPPTPRPPSVAFVTSVRCFPRFAQFSHGSHRVHQPSASLCGLRDLCAMLSPIRPVLARKPPCPPTFRPPSVAFVTSVRCFPRFAQFSHGSRRVHQPSGLPLWPS